MVENGDTKWKSGVRATSLTRNMKRRGIGKDSKHYWNYGTVFILGKKIKIKCFILSAM